jgi:membrane-associated phospholipid phosphatase
MSPKNKVAVFAVLALATICALPLRAQQGPSDSPAPVETAVSSSSTTSTSSDAALPDAPSALLEPAAAPAADPGADFRTGRKGDIPLQDEIHPPVTFQRVPLMFGEDMGHIFVSPIYLRLPDLEWLLPLAGATAAAFATDTHVSRDIVSHNPSFNNTAGTISDSLRDTYIAVPVFIAAGGQLTHNDHVRETGILGGQALLDAFVVDEVVKVVSYRERPNVDNARGNFYVGSSGGLDSSFVSGHAMITWAAASAMAGEYNNKWVKTLSYTGATAVSVNRVLALQHFPTDVLLGSAGGWLIGHYVYRAHHHAPHGKMEKAVAAMSSHIDVEP